MAINREEYFKLSEQLPQKNVTLVAVSKTKPPEEILELYEMGQRDFGENYVQELVDKQQQLPADIRWHFIGHLQSNKVKYIAPFVHLVQGVDSYKLLAELSKQAGKNGRLIHCLLQVHIATEESKFGFSDTELAETMERVAAAPLPGLSVDGLMGMASFTEDASRVREEFRVLKRLFDRYNGHNFGNSGILSMGMSGDYLVAIEEGSNMVRIGSRLFGERK